MPTLNTEHFGLRLANLPLQNLRIDFNNLFSLFRSERFRKQFTGYKGKSIAIKTHHFTWDGRAQVLLTYLLRDAIVSIECTVSGAVFVESLLRGAQTDEVVEATRNPTRLARGTANAVYNKLPALLDESWALEVSDRDLWKRTKEFYSKVRNPIFHAYEVADPDPEPVWKCLEFLWELFQWLNNWHPIERLSASEASSSGFQDRRAAEGSRFGLIVGSGKRNGSTPLRWTPG